MHFLTIVVATLIGAVVGSMVTAAAQDGVTSATDLMGFAVYGGIAGAFFAILASSAIVLFGRIAWVVCLVVGPWLLALGVWRSVVHHDGAPISIIGWSALASVLADYIARRADVTVSAAGPVAPQGQNPQSSGDFSQK